MDKMDSMDEMDKGVHEGQTLGIAEAMAPLRNGGGVGGGRRWAVGA